MEEPTYNTSDKRLSALIKAQGIEGAAAVDLTGTVIFAFPEEAATKALARINANETCGLLDVLRAMKTTEDLLWMTIRKGR